ncbi:MAG: S-layer homology domain-containing protein, partial [Zhaonellaceae bacterium]
MRYTKTTEISYSDVASADWYYVEVAKAMAAGYISGYEDGTIRPKNPISRQEAAAMLARILKLDTTANLQALDNFTDKDNIPAWSKGAIAAVVAEGFMSGYPDGTFRPTRNITRAEAIVMLDNAVETTIIYEEEGTYGPEEDVETIKGNVTIASDGITLRNVIINGDLLIAEEVGDGEVKLKNVTVKGEVIVKGGGPNSVELEDCNIPKITVSKDGVRIVASGNTRVSIVTLETGAILVQTTVTGSGFEEVTITEEVPANAKITLSGDFENITVEANRVNVEVESGTIKELNITEDAEDTTVTVSKEAKVETMTINAPVEVKGEGTVAEANVNVTD